MDPAEGETHFGEGGRDQAGDEGRGREGDCGLRRDQGVEQGAQELHHGAPEAGTIFSAVVRFRIKTLKFHNSGEKGY